jgi:hypothetical protein
MRPHDASRGRDGHSLDGLQRAQQPEQRRAGGAREMGAHHPARRLQRPFSEGPFAAIADDVRAFKGSIAH